MRYLICLTLLISMPLHAGAIKKWVDESGNVHYGDAPPVSAKSQDVRVQRAPSNPGKALPRLGNSDREPDTTANTEAGDVPEDQARIACQQARDDLKVMNRSSRIKLRQADGTERYLSTEEIAERKSRAEADVERFCQ